MSPSEAGLSPVRGGSASRRGVRTSSRIRARDPATSVEPTSGTVSPEGVEHPRTPRHLRAPPTGCNRASAGLFTVDRDCSPLRGWTRAERAQRCRPTWTIVAEHDSRHGGIVAATLIIRRPGRCRAWSDGRSEPPPPPTPEARNLAAHHGPGSHDASPGPWCVVSVGCFGAHRQPVSVRPMRRIRSPSPRPRCSPPCR